MYAISRLKVLESIPSPVVTACHLKTQAAQVPETTHISNIP